LTILRGERVTVRPGGQADVADLLRILAEPSVARWWGMDAPHDDLLDTLEGRSDVVRLVVEVDGQVAGAVEYYEEPQPEYRHANIDVFLGSRFQGRGLGTELVGLVARFLVGDCGHHRLTIDPAVDNVAAIRCYEKVGFRRVGVMREYELGPDGTYHDGLLMDLLAAELTPTTGR
jgi:aminoglycoside 6'-N-acetyltransferase